MKFSQSLSKMMAGQMKPLRSPSGHVSETSEHVPKTCEDVSENSEHVSEISFLDWARNEEADSEMYTCMPRKKS